MSEHGWQQAAETQLELFKFWRSPLGIAYGEVFLNDKAYKSPVRRGFEPNPEYKRMIAGEYGLANLEASKMFLADPVYVAPEMFEIAEAASETFRPEPLEASDLITQSGFLLLPEPFVVPDAFGIDTTFRAFAWMPCNSEDGKKHGIHLTTYTSIEDDELDGYDLKEWQAKGREIPWQPLHAQPWWFGDEAPPVAETGAGWWIKVQALFRLMMQHISIREERQPPRATRRRWQRDVPERPSHERYVVVVRLRRPKSAPTGEERNVEWKQRWIVGGHWRAQWFPSLGIHRQIYINDYVKGPEDKPLVVRKARAFELVQ